MVQNFLCFVFTVHANACKWLEQFLFVELSSNVVCVLIVL